MLYHVSQSIHFDVRLIIGLLSQPGCGRIASGCDCMPRLKLVLFRFVVFKLFKFAALPRFFKSTFRLLL